MAAGHPPRETCPIVFLVPIFGTAWNRHTLRQYIATETEQTSPCSSHHLSPLGNEAHNKYDILPDVQDEARYFDTVISVTKSKWFLGVSWRLKRNFPGKDGRRGETHL